jgi:hypothetical protein
VNTIRGTFGGQPDATVSVLFNGVGVQEQQSQSRTAKERSAGSQNQRDLLSMMFMWQDHQVHHRFQLRSRKSWSQRGNRNTTFHQNSIHRRLQRHALRRVVDAV